MSDVPPSPEPADDHDSIIPGLDPAPLDRQDLAPDADTAGDPGQRRGGRGRALTAVGGGVVVVVAVVVAILALSRQGGQPGTAVAGTEQATTASGQPGATASQAGAPAGQSPQSRQSAPASQAGALPSARSGGVTASGSYAT